MNSQHHGEAGIGPRTGSELSDRLRNSLGVRHHSSPKDQRATHTELTLENLYWDAGITRLLHRLIHDRIRRPLLRRPTGGLGWRVPR